MTDECVTEMKERGVWLVPTLAAVKNILKGYDDGDRSIPDYVIEKARRVFDRHIASIKMYYKAGGRIAMGTDAGTPHNRHGENARELEYMCEIGISTRDSLFFSTASARRPDAPVPTRAASRKATAPTSCCATAMCWPTSSAPRARRTIAWW